MLDYIGQPLADIHIRLFVGLILFFHHSRQSGPLELDYRPDRFRSAQ
jgi:hypothetical protein